MQRLILVGRLSAISFSLRDGKRIGRIRRHRMRQPCVSRSQAMCVCPLKSTLAGRSKLRPNLPKVGFQVSGKVIRVGPREGDFVKTGDVLAVIDPADYQFALESAVAQTALARAHYEKAYESARPEVVEQARANLSQAEDEFRRMKILYENKSLAPNDFKKYETALTNAQQRYEEAKQGAQREDKAAAKASLEQAEAAERIARKRLSDATLIAPVSRFHRGTQHRSRSDGYCRRLRLHDRWTGPVEIQVGVPEADIRLVRPGQQAIVTTSALPGMTFSGRVRLVNVSAEPQTRTYMVRITVPNPKRTLLVGMIAEARILLSEERGCSDTFRARQSRATCTAPPKSTFTIPRRKGYTPGA